MPAKLVLDLVIPEVCKAYLTLLAGYIVKWYTHLQMVTHPSTNWARHRVTSLICPTMLVCVLVLALDAKAELERELAADSAMPAIKQLESRECVGMFEYRKDEEQLLVDNLITGNDVMM